jgi:two-component system response regulator MprA
MINLDPRQQWHEAKMRILVVDDDPEIVSFVRRGLAYEGYTVVTAADGKEALTKGD